MTIATRETSTVAHAPRAGAAAWAAGGFELKLLEPTLGGAVAKLDLHQPLDAQRVAALRAALLAFLRQHASGVNYQYRNHWQAGDLVIWDNRSVWHYAVDDYGDQERWGLKISIEGGDWRPN